MSAAAGRDLLVSEIFGPTLQGEGPSAGRRCGFLRLGGCNLDCAWCDTPYTWDWSRYRPGEQLQRMGPAAVVAALVRLDVDMVVITGGEPLLQQEALAPVLEELTRRGWRVEVETNGTVAPRRDVAALVDQFNVSPKLANSGVAEERRLRPDALAGFRAGGRAVFKFVVAGPEDLDEVDRVVADHRLDPVFVMPEGTDASVIMARMRRLAEPSLVRGYSLSPRLHILLWGNTRGR